MGTHARNPFRSSVRVIVFHEYSVSGSTQSSFDSQKEGSLGLILLIMDELCVREKELLNVNRTVTLERKYTERMNTNHQCKVVSPNCINIHEVHQV